jgi:hypothetical protein
LRVGSSSACSGGRPESAPLTPAGCQRGFPLRASSPGARARPWSWGGAATPNSLSTRLTRTGLLSMLPRRTITVVMGSADDPRLDHVVYAALTGAQSRFAEVRGRAVRYPADVAPFLAVPREPSAPDWIDAAAQVPVGSVVAVEHLGDHAPDQWELVRQLEGGADGRGARLRGRRSGGGRAWSR